MSTTAWLLVFMLGTHYSFFVPGIYSESECFALREKIQKTVKPGRDENYRCIPYLIAR